jgi:hypothetical protein
MIKPHSKFFFINHQITPISEYLDAFATQTYSPPYYISLLHGLVSVCFLATQLSIRATSAWICRQEILLFLVMLILMNINFPLLNSRLHRRALHWIPHHLRRICCPDEPSHPPSLHAPHPFYTTTHPASICAHAFHANLRERWDCCS